MLFPILSRYYHKIRSRIALLFVRGLFSAPLLGTLARKESPLHDHESVGKDCVGCFISTHYAAPGAKGATKQFIDQYKAKCGYEPDTGAALTWDAARPLLQAVQSRRIK